MDTVGAVVEDLDVARGVDRRERLFNVGVLVEKKKKEETEGGDGRRRRKEEKTERNKAMFVSAIKNSTHTQHTQHTTHRTNVFSSPSSPLLSHLGNPQGRMRDIYKPIYIYINLFTW